MWNVFSMVYDAALPWMGNLLRSSSSDAGGSLLFAEGVAVNYLQLPKIAPVGLFNILTAAISGAKNPTIFQ